VGATRSGPVPSARCSITLRSQASVYRNTRRKASGIDATNNLVVNIVMLTSVTLDLDSALE
jgi:hypothetical protein